MRRADPRSALHRMCAYALDNRERLLRRDELTFDLVSGWQAEDTVEDQSEAKNLRRHRLDAELRDAREIRRFLLMRVAPDEGYYLLIVFLLTLLTYTTRSVWLPCLARVHQRRPTTTTASAPPTTTTADKE